MLHADLTLTKYVTQNPTIMLPGAVALSGGADGFVEMAQHLEQSASHEETWNRRLAMCVLDCVALTCDIL